jgi:hypothetical protein
LISIRKQLPPKGGQVDVAGGCVEYQKATAYDNRFHGFHHRKRYYGFGAGCETVQPAGRPAVRGG